MLLGHVNDMRKINDLHEDNDMTWQQHGCLEEMHALSCTWDHIVIINCVSSVIDVQYNQLRHRLIGCEINIWTTSPINNAE